MIWGEQTYFRYDAAALVQRLFEELTGEQYVPEELGLDGLDIIELIAAFESELEEAL